MKLRLFGNAEQSLRELDDSLVEQYPLVADLEGKLSSRVQELKTLNEKHAVLTQKHSECSEKMELTANLLSAEPADSAGLSTFRKILHGDFMEFANKESSLAEEAKAILLMQEIERDLETVVAYPKIFQKNIIAVGGGFSSGKSALANSFFENDNIQLPIGIEPVTAIPTYIVSDTSDSMSGFASGGGEVKLNASICGKLSHDYVKSFGFNLRDIMPYMAVGTPLNTELFEHLCLIDTPGYNPADSDGYTNEDTQTALTHLQTAHALIWVIGLDSNGTIPSSDLDILENIDLSTKNLFVVANKADLRAQSELEEILANMKETFNDYDISFKGLSAYSSEKRREYHSIDQSLHDFLREQNRSVSSKDMVVQKLRAVFAMYTKSITEDMEQNTSTRNELNSMQLDLLESGIEPETARMGTLFAELYRILGLGRGSREDEDTQKGGVQLHERIKNMKNSFEGETKKLAGYLKEISPLQDSMIKAIDDIFTEIDFQKE